MEITAKQIALSIDVWNVIEDELKTGIQDGVLVELKYDAGEGLVSVNILRGEQQSHCVKLIDEEATSLITALCERFNVDTTCLNRLEVELNVHDLPFFNATYFPYVDDYMTLEENAHRLNAKTIS